jgi:ribosome maturation protein SDO1
VLQINNVFINVSKGEVAGSDDLKKSFGKMKVDAIVKEVRIRIESHLSHSTSRSQILNTGELQVGEKERAHDQAALWRELATLVAEKCMDPETHRPYSVGIIEKAMTEAGFSLKQDKTAKSQVCSNL